MDDSLTMAPGGLRIIKTLSDALEIKKGSSILDLGSGKGLSSIWLAKHLDADVVSIDLWTPVQPREELARKENVSNKITFLQGDIKKGLPSHLRNFDYIVSWQAFHIFGHLKWILTYLDRLLHDNGRIGILQTCFNQEVEELPLVYQMSDGWNTDYENYHSPQWWQNHFDNSDLFRTIICEELPDGQQLWIDDLIKHGENRGWDKEFLTENAWLMAHLIYGTSKQLYLTHMMLTAEKLPR